ncbi:ARP2/3 complex subunit, putative [Bodo saltans]|uniref:Arp2/3 complex 34 kDa subunit n=1 Tax=Bodo saltans TaxID=75058 RepID=A0A0S4KIN2_BODSA|nr:ARP2/3 complex subunit, putative [Bodo saltans]|eukprot:CUI14264.1 ARP2/3 complex subunit, putative [Bodo saltans]
MILLEDLHPALINALERMVRRENSVDHTAVKDFDGTELFVQIDRTAQEEEAAAAKAAQESADPGSPTVVDPDAEAISQRNVMITLTLQHIVPRTALQQFGNFEEIIESKFPKGAKLTFTPTKERPNAAVTLTIPAGTSDANREDLAQRFSQLRAWSYLPLFQQQFDIFLGGKAAGAMKPLRIPYHPNESMYIYAARGGADFVVLISMIIDGKDDQVFTKNFLQTFQDAKRLQKELASGPGFVYSQQTAPTDAPAGMIGEPETEQTFWVSFQLQRSHMEGTDAAKTRVVTNLVNFRNYLLYHIHCCRSYMHGLMRGRVEKSLLVLNRAKTSTTGRSRVVIK